MGKTGGLEYLRRALPAMPEVPEIDKETGEEYYAGFTGNISQSPTYVTDGHILLLASAIDPAVEIWRDEDCWFQKNASKKAIEKVWKAAEEREEIVADFIGVGLYCESIEEALLCDAQGRVMVVNAYLLAFCIHAVHPDVLTVNGAPIDRWFDSPLALRRGGSLVGLLMPMRISAEESFAQYDLHGKPVDLTAAMAR
jgi:hypothetical protein